jgi:hypothetical protein
MSNLAAYEHGTEHLQVGKEDTPEDRDQGQTLPLRKVPQAQPEAGHDAGPLVLPELSQPTRGVMTAIAPGRYRHFKGKEYTVLGVARHSETHEELVVYRQEYGDHGFWARPKEMFLQTVEVNGEQVPRFRFLGNE